MGILFLVLILATRPSANTAAQTIEPPASTTPTTIGWLASSVQQCALAPAPADIDLEKVYSDTVVTAHYAHGAATDATVTLTSGNSVLDQRAIECTKKVPAAVAAALSDGEKVSVPVFWETPAKLIATRPGLAPAIMIAVAPFANVPPHPCDRLYPPEAIRRGEVGATVLRVKGIPQGPITHADIIQSSGYELLDKAAIACVMLRTYRPYPTTDPNSGMPVKIYWSLVKPGPIKIDPVPGPPGWVQKDGVKAPYVAAYEWPEAEGSFHQYVLSGVNVTEETLDQYAAHSLPGAPGVPYHLIDEKWSMVCGNEPAFELESSTGTGPGRLIDDEVVFVRDHLVYFAAYVRREPDARRADANEWIQSFCRYVR